VLRETVIVRGGYLCRCAYELAQHERFIAELGVSPERIAALAVGASQDPLTSVKRAVLRFTDDVITNVRAGDATLEELQRHLPDKQIIEVIMTAGCYRMLCMLLESADVEVENPDSDAHRLSQAQWRERMRAPHD
jgi:4-carboxymuconolactone decarboxylase